jgi:hypothetical protein
MKKLWALHGLRTGILVAVLAVAVAGATLAIKAPSAHAAVVPPGGCSYYDTEAYGIWNTNLCANGPFYSSGHKYYTYQASCWVNSAAVSQNVLAWVYFLGCSIQDKSAVTLNWMFKTSPGYTKYNTPATVLVLTSQVYKATTLPTELDIWINGNAGIRQADCNDPCLGTLVVVPPNGSAESIVHVS